MTHLAKQLPAFCDLVEYVTDNRQFMEWLEMVNPEQNVPECWTVKKELSMGLDYMSVLQGQGILYCPVIINMPIKCGVLAYHKK